MDWEKWIERFCFICIGVVISIIAYALVDVGTFFDDDEEDFSDLRCIHKRLQSLEHQVRPKNFGAYD